MLWALALQPDGRIVVAGSDSRDDDIDNSQTWWSAARLQPDGSLDASFGNLGRDYGTFTPPPPAGPGTLGYTDVAQAVAISGGIVLAGYGRATGAGANAATRFGVVRVTLDAIFADAFE